MTTSKIFPGKIVSNLISPSSQIYQVMEALDYGDAVSRITIDMSKLLGRLGAYPTILSIYADQRVKNKTTELKSINFQSHDAIILHYWNFSNLETFLKEFKGLKALYFHNITPPRYFNPRSMNYQATQKGLEQLSRIADWFDLIIGDSNYNLEFLQNYLFVSKPTITIYPVFEQSSLLAEPFDNKLYNQLKQNNKVIFLFVGRIVKNKRQDKIITVFDYYYRWINRDAQLILIGDFSNNLDYYEELLNLKNSLFSGNQIIFTGKISHEELGAYYRAGKIFLSASEHEGFGMPLLEAMAFGLPVIALGKAAIPEILGQSGIIINNWDPSLIGELVNILLKDSYYYNKITNGQFSNLVRFSEKQAQQKMSSVITYLKQGKIDDKFTWRGPHPQ